MVYFWTTDSREWKGKEYNNMGAEAGFPLLTIQ